MHFIQEVFGENCNLYEDVLQCTKDVTNAQLRKAYYRTALKHHPDKNMNDPNSARKFQAINMTYQILQNHELRTEYDETGIIPSDELADEDTTNTNGIHQWKEYFDKIFGRVTTNGIEAFASKYKCSDEECRDVIKEYIKRKGNLIKMLEFVMLSEPRDAQRWVEDYIRPAIQNKEVQDFSTTLDKTLNTLKKRIEKEEKEQQQEEEEDDDESSSSDDEEVEAVVVDEDATESEDDDEDEDESSIQEHKKRRARKSSTDSKSSKKQKGGDDSTKKKTTTTKNNNSTNNNKKKGKKKNDNSKNDMSDLIAKIQNKHRGGGNNNNIMASLGARYGIENNNDDDPLNDDEFNKIQAKLFSSKKNNKNKNKR